MAIQANKTPTLSFNKATGYYEGTLLVQVDAEIFRRLLIQAVEEDTTADLTDPQTWIAAIEKVGKITNWLDRPHVKVTPIASSHAIETKEVAQPEKQSSVEQVQHLHISKTKAQLLEVRLRESAQHVPPHKWDECCLTPTPSPNSVSPKERASIGRLRYDERQVLKQLREEWNRGEFALDEEATRQEMAYKGIFAEKLEAVADAVNGNGFH